MTKLTEEQRQDITARLQAGERQSRIARDYGMLRQTIARYRVRPEPLPATPLNGALERARCLSSMSKDRCGGCGQDALCEPLLQTDSRFPSIMWLCGECRSFGVWK